MNGSALFELFPLSVFISRVWVKKKVVVTFYLLGEVRNYCLIKYKTMHIK